MTLIEQIKEESKNYPTHEESMNYIIEQGWSFDHTEFNRKEFDRLCNLHYSDDMPIDDLKKVAMIWNAYFNHRITRKR